MNPKPAASGLGVSFPQHADKHRPEHTVLLAVDHEFAERGAFPGVPRTRRSARRGRGLGDKRVLGLRVSRAA
jgi:hypothetical protein